jgi:hypothetical protein
MVTTPQCILIFKAYDLLNQLLEFNPDKRIGNSVSIFHSLGIEDALKHKYFQDIYSEKDLKKFEKFDYRFDDSVTLEEDPDHVKSKLIHLKDRNDL